VRLPGNPLQWGRGLAAAESASPEGMSLVGSLPSMGPRPCSRGKVTIRRRGSGRPGRPSMGPRPCSRGKRTSGFVRSADRAWAFNGAAALQPRKAFNGYRPRAIGSGPFNGAAALQPRKDQDYRGGIRESSSPSMGPRPCSRGKLSPRPGGGTNLGPFNGAAALQPRKDQS